MFQEFIKPDKIHAKFCWLQPNGDEHEEHLNISKETLRTLKRSKGYRLNAPILRASFGGNPIPSDMLPKGSVTAYSFREIVELFEYIRDALPEETDLFPDIFVTGGFYDNSGEKEFRLETPSKNGYPYTYIGMPWHPISCVYRLSEKGTAIKVRDSAAGNSFEGPDKVELSPSLIAKIQKSLQQMAIYKG